MNNEVILLEEVAGKAIITAVNFFAPKVGEIELHDKSGKVVCGVVANPDIVKGLINSFGVTPWVGVPPLLIAKKSTKDGTISLKLASQIDSAKLPKLVDRKSVV